LTSILKINYHEKKLREIFVLLNELDQKNICHWKGSLAEDLELFETKRKQNFIKFKVEKEIINEFDKKEK